MPNISELKTLVEGITGKGLSQGIALNEHIECMNAEMTILEETGEQWAQGKWQSFVN